MVIVGFLFDLHDGVILYAFTCVSKNGFRIGSASSFTAERSIVPERELSAQPKSWEY